MKKTLKLMAMLLCSSAILFTTISCESSAEKEAKQRAETERYENERKAQEEKAMREQQEENERYYLEQSLKMGREFGIEEASYCYRHYVNTPNETASWKIRKRNERVEYFTNANKYEIEKGLFDKCVEKFKDGFNEAWDDYYREHPENNVSTVAGYGY